VLGTVLPLVLQSATFALSYRHWTGSAGVYIGIISLSKWALSCDKRT